MAAIAELRLGVAGLRHGVPENDLSDIETDVAVRVHGSSEPRRGGGEVPLALGPIAVELRVRQMDRISFDGIDGGERSLDIAGHTEVVAVDVKRMWDAELVHRAREGTQDRARRDAVPRADRKSTRLNSSHIPLSRM